MEIPYHIDYLKYCSPTLNGFPILITLPGVLGPQWPPTIILLGKSIHYSLCYNSEEYIVWYLSIVGHIIQPQNPIEVLNMWTMIEYREYWRWLIVFFGQHWSRFICEMINWTLHIARNQPGIDVFQKWLLIMDESRSYSMTKIGV